MDITLVLILAATFPMTTARTPLYVGALFELSDNWFAKYTRFFPTVIDYALQHIRNRTDILPDYDLTFVYKDTKALEGFAVKQMIELIEEKDRPKVAILGPSLSPELTLTGQVAPFYDVIEVSCIATTASTVNDELYPTVFTINRLPHMLNRLRIEMTRYFGWRLIGTLAIKKEYSTSQIELFHDELKKLPDNDIELVATALVANITNIKYAIKRFKDYNVRIIHAVFSTGEAPYVFCEAYKQGMFGSSYVWILSGPNMYGNIMAKFNDDTGCTWEQVVAASDGYFTLDYPDIGESNTVTINGQGAQDITDELIKKVSDTQAYSNSVSLVYDSIWSLALGLNHSLKYLDVDGLAGFNYSRNYRNAIMNGLKETDFIGMSGRVHFDGTRFRHADSLVLLHRNDSFILVTVATFDNNNDANTTGIFKLLTDPWPDGWPADKFTTSLSYAPSSGIAFGLIVTLMSAGLLLSLSFLAFNIYYRKQRSIKMSSPVMNNIMIVGCTILYVEVFLSALHYRRCVNTDTCMVRAWLVCIGFTILFGALFSKTYRVYAIFRDGSYKSKIIKDYHLFAKVGVLLVIDCIILIPWTLLHPRQLSEYSKEVKKLEDKNVIFYTVYSNCHGNNEDYWFGIIYVYKGLLLALGTFLAWETRTVSIPELNDSKYIGACVYNVVIACVFGVPVIHVLSNEQTTLSFVLEASLCIFCTTICIGLIFIPKIRTRNQVHGQFILPSLNSTAATAFTDRTKQQGAHSGIVSDTQSESVCASQSGHYSHKNNGEDMAKENAALRLQIAKEDTAMEKLRQKLLQVEDLDVFKDGNDYVVSRKGTSNI